MMEKQRNSTVYYFDMAYEFSKISVLIVESNNAMFHLARDVLRAFGIYDVYSAYSVAEGFEKFCETNPDLIIIDWLKNEDSGVALTKKIRMSDQSPNPFVPIIMMTGFSQKRRVTLARDSGITEFIVKPYNAATLYDKIESIIEKPRQFIKTENFFGPDRRRRSEEQAPHLRRRREDESLPQSIEKREDEKNRYLKPSDIARAIQSKNKGERDA